VNAKVLGRRRDFTWWEKRLVVESDGWQAHGTHLAFENDRRRDAELIEKGWTVLRITHDRLAEDPAGVAAQLTRILARRS
jgi:very-short-patch-repair endonuclease